MLWVTLPLKHLLSKNVISVGGEWRGPLNSERLGNRKTDADIFNCKILALVRQVKTHIDGNGYLSKSCLKPLVTFKHRDKLMTKLVTIEVELIKNILSYLWGF